MPPDAPDCRIVVADGDEHVAFVDAGSSTSSATIVALDALIRRLSSDAVVTVRGRSQAWADDVVAWAETTDLAVEPLAAIPQTAGVIVTLRRCPPGAGRSRG